MPEETTTPDLTVLVHRAVDAMSARDFEAEHLNRNQALKALEPET
jgi:hypothetical protein